MKPTEYIKKGLTYLMLIAYVFGILKPLSPIAADIIAHTFDQAHHMATVHFENGKYHVHKEIAVEAAEESPKKNTAQTFSPDELLGSHVQSNVYTFSVNYTETSVIDTDTDTRFSDIFFKTFSPPPEV
ncbi:MAG: hypothetical protein K0S33_4141 [Bacteroidetes bacterium]|jgi:hypothetical protein|nr:hypothetical protein [Bacteroidota bacterium]